MEHEENASRSMSEISHLFLSNVRNLHGQGQPRPQRRPPPTLGSMQDADALDSAATPAMTESAAPEPHELTPEEYDHVLNADTSAAVDLADPAPVAPFTVLLASHFGARQLERAQDYAKHRCLSVGRVGLIDLDASEFRLFAFEPVAEPGLSGSKTSPVVTGVADARHIAQTLEELNFDVNEWVLLLPNLRTPEARQMLRDCQHWLLLTTCDHDGVVSSYRTIKGIADAFGSRSESTRLSVATVDSAGDAESNRVQQKLAQVCGQFLQISLQFETPVRYAGGVAELSLMDVRVPGDKAQLAAAPHWDIVARMLSRSNEPSSETNEAVAAPAEGIKSVAAKPAVQANAAPTIEAAPINAERAAATPAIRRIEPEQAAPEALARPVATQSTPANAVEFVVPSVHTASMETAPIEKAPPASMPLTPKASSAAGAIKMSSAPAPASGVFETAARSQAPSQFVGVRLSEPTPATMRFQPAGTSRADDDEVIDLPGDATGSADAILGAVMARPQLGLASCPVTVPQCPCGRLAVGRDGGLTLVAAASRGLPELRNIGRAFQWMLENRALISMAIPQFAVDAKRLPTLVLLVDQADISADLLAPMMEARHVTVQAYRTLRWAGKTGLLLQAA